MNQYNESTNKKMKNGLSRRGFLTGAAALTAAATLPLVAGCSPSNEKSASAEDASSVSWDHEADIIAVGAGAAGLSCAIEATEQGLSCIVLESQSMVGGSSALCNGGISMPGTPLQKEQGIEDSIDLFYEDLSTMTREDNNLEWLKLHCELAGGLWDWLTGMGLEFKEESLLPTQGQSVPREHHIVPTTVIDTLKSNAEADGAEVITKMPVAELVYDPSSNRVLGVRAEDGTTYKANKGVLLSAGGYSRNTDMLNGYIFGTGAEGIFAYGGQGDDGSGIKMAQALGADTRHMGWVSLLTGQNPDGSAGNSCSLMNGGAIMVNLEGERFVNESQGYGNVWVDVSNQTDQICYQIWDEDIAVEYAENDSSLYSMAKLRESGLLISADTLEDLAAQIGLPSDVLAATVAKYNSDITETGADTLFGRATKVSQVGTPPLIDTAPYYAWKTCNVMYSTMGGLKHNLDMQVVNVFDDVIGGLYCAGGICTYANMGVKPSTIRGVGASGTGFGGALIWGRYVAQKIAELEA